MQRIRAEQFDSLDRNRFRYFATGKIPRYYLLPVVLFMLTAVSIIVFALVRTDNLTLGLKIMISAVFCLPICSNAIVILVKLIVAVVGYSKISFAIYNDSLYIKSKKEYLIFDQTQLVDAAIKADSIRTRDMKRSQVPALDLDSGSIKLQMTEGDFLFSCSNLEKTATVLLAIIEGKNIHTVLDQYGPSFDNNFAKGLLKVTTGFGFLCFLELFTVMIGMLLGFSLAIIIVLATLGFGTFCFGIFGVLYVFISPQLKENNAETKKAKESIDCALPASQPVSTTTDVMVAAAIKRKCRSYIKNILPFFVICILADIGITVGICYGIYQLAMAALFLLPFTIFVFGYVIVNTLHIRTADRIVDHGEYCVAKIIDFRLGAQGLGRMTLEFVDKKKERIVLKTPYHYKADHIKAAAALGSANIKFYKKRVLVIF